MNRALPLLLLAAAIAGGLGYFALMGPGAIPQAEPDADTSVAVTPPPNATARAESSSASRSDLASVNPDRAALDAEASGGVVREWEIITMNAVGQRVPSAKITATRGTETRTGDERVRWNQVAAGTWNLVVEAEGEPRWEREVTLEAGSRKRTVAQLGREIRIRGTVVDTNGDAVGRTTVYFLPAGESHPQNAVPLQPEVRQPSEPIDPKSQKGRIMKSARAARAPADTVAVQTSPDGRFRVILPKAGTWRVSVGPLGEARWTQSRGTELVNGGPDSLLVTVPALAKLGLTFSGPDEERPSQVTVYAFDAELASRIETQRSSPRGRSGGDGGTGPTSVEEAQILAKKRALINAGGKGGETGVGKGGQGGKGSGTARPAFEENADVVAEGLESGTGGVERPQRTPLFEPGWRALRSTPITGEETVINDLPGQEQLKFLFVRGRERITTASSTRLREEEYSLGTVSLPRPDTGSAGVVQSNLASLSVRVLPKDKSEKVEPGVVWSFQD